MSELSWKGVQRPHLHASGTTPYPSHSHSHLHLRSDGTDCINALHMSAGAIHHHYADANWMAGESSGQKAFHKPNFFLFTCALRWHWEIDLLSLQDFPGFPFRSSCVYVCYSFPLDIG